MACRWVSERIRWRFIPPRVNRGRSQNDYAPCLQSKGLVSALAVGGRAPGPSWALAFILGCQVFFEKYRRNLNLTCRVTEEVATIGHLKSCFLYKRKPGHTRASPQDQFGGQRPPS